MVEGRSDCIGKLGAVGFCFGGGIVNTLAMRMGSELSAGVPFCGAQPNAADTAKIKAPLMLQYARLDARITGGAAAFEEALKANHAAAKLAWQRTIDFFNNNLRTGV